MGRAVSKRPPTPEWLKTRYRIRRFVSEWCVHQSIKKAAVALNVSESTCRSLLRKPQVQKLIEAELDLIAEHSRITPQRVLQEQSRLAFSKPTDVFTWTDEGTLIVKSSEDIPEGALAAIKKIKHTEERGGAKKIEIEFYDKQAALSSIQKVLGMEKINIRVSNDPLNEVPEEIIDAILIEDIETRRIEKAESEGADPEGVRDVLPGLPAPDG